MFCLSSLSNHYVSETFMVHQISSIFNFSTKTTWWNRCSNFVCFSREQNSLSWSYWVQSLWLCTSSVLTSLGSSPACTKHLVKDKKMVKHILSVHSESVFKPCTEFINCLHPGALNTHMWNHINDAPRLPFMSHFKWKFDLACLHRISSSSYLNPYGQAEGEGN